MDRILDFVPNHMGVGGADNPLWLDVLEWGPNPNMRDGSISTGRNRRVGRPNFSHPCSARHYGEALRSGALVLKLDDDGSLAIWAHDEHKLPLCPLSYAAVLGHENPNLDRWRTVPRSAELASSNRRARARV